MSCDKMSVLRNVNVTKCPVVKCLCDNVSVTKYPVTICLVTKCPPPDLRPCQVLNSKRFGASCERIIDVIDPLVNGGCCTLTRFRDWAFFSSATARIDIPSPGISGFFRFSSDAFRNLKSLIINYLWIPTDTKLTFTAEITGIPLNDVSIFQILGLNSQVEPQYYSLFTIILKQFWF